MQLELSQYISEKYSIVRFYENTYVGPELLETDGHDAAPPPQFC